jgi:queuine tRNA-ribosyltransferase
MLDVDLSALPRGKAALPDGCRHARRHPQIGGRGIDMFDCVMPTRAGRHGLAFTRHGKINLKNARHAEDHRPLDEQSDPARRRATIRAPICITCD